MASHEFAAIESQAGVRKALRNLQEKLEVGGEPIEGFVRGATIWNPRLGMWSHFQNWKRKDKTDRHWNGFGFMRDHPRRRIIVEINPPVVGKYKGMQGAVAVDKSGHRWLLHQGRLSIPHGHVSEANFDRVTKRKRVAVWYKGDRKDMCFPVTDIDADPLDVQDRLSSYVLECKRVRQHYISGATVAAEEEKIIEAERTLALIPESIDDYLRGPQSAKIVKRRHGRVWDALSKALSSLGKQHTTERVGRWGPDLRTVEKAVLFEIKVSSSSSDLQKAVGQLLMYEQMLERSFIKVIVLPNEIEGSPADAIERLGIETLRYSQAGRRITFKQEELRALVQ